MDWNFAFAIGVPALIVIAGWFFVHHLNVRREFAVRKREARLKALEAAYLRIATSANQDLTEESIEKIEMFVSEIQLYGTPRQIQLMTEMVETFIAGKVVSYDALLSDLRDAIRKELDLEQITGNVWWLRLARPQTTIPEPTGGGEHK